MPWKIWKRKGLIERSAESPRSAGPQARSAVGKLQLAFVAPSNAPQSFSLDIQQWLAAADFVARGKGAKLRVVNYHHWDDAAISDALRSYDGIFFVTSSETIPPWAATLLQSSNGVISLSDDLTHLGVPSIVLFPHVFVQQLFIKLQDLGHQQIDCFNIQGHNAVTLARIDEWQKWTSRHCPRAELIDVPCEVGENTFEAGLKAARERFSNLAADTTAIFCVTLPAAMGAIRALGELGRQVGKDVSIITIDGEGLAKILVPSITCFERPDARQYMPACIEWFAAGGRREDWAGPLLVQPKALALFEGESSGPVCKHSNTRPTRRG